MRRYSLAGLGISSDLELPLPAGPSLATDVVLKVGPPLSEGESPITTAWNWKRADDAELRYVGLGRARIRGGQEIFLRACPSAPAQTEWRGLIVPCFAALFHQRGNLSLHASAVRINGRAVGFMGYCGAGKSTLVAQLTGAEIQFLCDDLLLLGKDEEARPLAYPGFSIIKLWDEAVRAAKGRFCRIGRLYPDADKDGFLPAAEESAFSPTPLDSLFVLRDGKEVQIDPLTKTEAVAELLRHTYGLQNFHQKPLAEHFRQCSDLAQRVPVKILTRPRTFACAEEVEEKIRESIGEGTVVSL